jgi:rubrerythrin
MPGLTVEPDDTIAIQRISEGAPGALPLLPPSTGRGHVCARCGAVKSGPNGRCARCGLRSGLDSLVDEPSAEVRAAQRRAARRIFRLYCLACGRASEGSTPPARPGRCPACGGTLLVEQTD